MRDLKTLQQEAWARISDAHPNRFVKAGEHPETMQRFIEAVYGALHAQQEWLVGLAAQMAATQEPPPEPPPSTPDHPEQPDSAAPVPDPPPEQATADKPELTTPMPVSAPPLPDQAPSEGSAQ